MVRDINKGSIMKLKTALLAGAAAMLLPLAASAQSMAERGFYIGAGGGIQHKESTKGDLFGGAARAGSTYDDLGWTANIAGGYDFGDGPRIELEGTYLRTGVKRSYSSPAGISTGGSPEVWAGLVNFLYDFDLGLPLKPYLGGGIGYARTDIGGSKDWGFAYQGIAGMSFDLMPQLKATLDYRYLATEKVNHGTNVGSYGDESAHHVGMLGLRWTFAEPVMVAAAPPPPPPAVRPAPPPPPPMVAPPVRNYIVFFDFDKSNLTTEARSQVRSASDSSKASGVTRIELTGHTDRSGSPQYNMALSQRRADAVKAELVRLGTPASQIVTYAKGESSPLVPTPDGVKEPQNRRVEIVLNR